MRPARQIVWLIKLQRPSISLSKQYCNSTAAFFYKLRGVTTWQQARKDESRIRIRR